jgi:uncharacterized protein (TIGR02001 family)
MKRVLMSTGSVVVAASALAMFGGVAMAQDGMSGVEISGNVAMTTDYRFRGVSLSDGDAAIQGGFDAAFDSGFYVGTWGSSIASYGGSEMELDLYAGYGGEIADGLGFDLGALLYAYPGGTDVNYYELYGSVSPTLGMVDTTFGIAYVPDQDNSDENTYLYADGGMPLGDSAFSLSGHIGYTDGALDCGGALSCDSGTGEIWDWSLGIATAVAGIDVDLSYVDTSEDGTGLDETAILTFSKSL